MNILFIGVGIVGQRHIRNIKLKFKNINLFTIRGKHSSQLYNEKEPLKGDVNSKYQLKVINFREINRNIKIDAAFICLPNNLHSKFLKKLFDKNINIFLEKPGGINYRDLKILKKIKTKNKKNKIKIMLGYHLRFNPAL